jgi:hypothetical protein
MKNVTTFAESGKNVEMSLTVLILKKNGKPMGSDFDIDRMRVNALGYMLDMIGAFSPRIISSLQRRMAACQQLLIAHLEDVEYNDGKHICWHRKDGTSGCFNIPSFRAMQDCVKALENSRFKEFTQKKVWIDQVLKALLNDTEQDHSDSGVFRYSQLVSTLCELQACPTEYLPK